MNEPDTMNAPNRLSAAFAKPHPALVCFLTAGDGDTAANLDAVVNAGWIAKDKLCQGVSGGPSPCN